MAVTLPQRSMLGRGFKVLKVWELSYSCVRVARARLALKHNVQTSLLGVNCVMSYHSLCKVPFVWGVLGYRVQDKVVAVQTQNLY